LSVTPASPATSSAIKDATVHRIGIATQTNLPRFAIVSVVRVEGESSESDLFGAKGLPARNDVGFQMGVNVSAEAKSGSSLECVVERVTT